MQDQIFLLQEEMERQVDNEKLCIKAECLEEMRSEREMDLYKKLRDKITKKLEKEILSKLPTELEGQVRSEIGERLIKEI
jgi:hypothetical protein